MGLPSCADLTRRHRPLLVLTMSRPIAYGSFAFPRVPLCLQHSMIALYVSLCGFSVDCSCYYGTCCDEEGYPGRCMPSDFGCYGGRCSAIGCNGQRNSWFCTWDRSDPSAQCSFGYTMCGPSCPQPPPSPPSPPPPPSPGEATGTQNPTGVLGCKKGSKRGVFNTV